ncbi:NHL repeat-containing protein [Streptomyces lavendulae]|uniref:NHL repeat-containing protein n=1 Tax=Streptomyces lavendulae TaxID=1914 RepID=UPI0031ECCB71
MTEVMPEETTPTPPDWVESTSTPRANIVTKAGNGKPDYTGDGCCATTTSLREPIGVAVDTAGNVYIAEYQNHRVRRLDATTGNITTVAGNGVAGYMGDGGDATLARLYHPIDVAVDRQGNLFIADQYNHRVRKVDPVSGQITTYAGTGVLGNTGDGSPATQARLNYPYGVAADSAGSIYIADTNNHKIRKVDPKGVINTFAGDGYAGSIGDGGPATKARLYYPQGVAVGDSGDVYIADSSNNKIRKVVPDPATGYGDISTVAGSGTPGFDGDAGPAELAKLNNPVRITVVRGSQGEDYYFSDTNNHRVRRVTVDSSSTPTKTVIHTVAGNGNTQWQGDGTPANSTTLYNPWGCAADSQGNVYIADRYTQRVRMLSGTTAPTRIDVRPGGLTNLIVNGDKGNPGVVVENTAGGTPAPQAVRVTLPSTGELKFLREGVPGRYVLTVWNDREDEARRLRLYYADADSNPEPTSLLFRNVDPDISQNGHASAMWVSVLATSGVGRIVNLQFDVGGHKSLSGEIYIRSAAGSSE